MPNSLQSSFIPKNNLPHRPKIGRRYNLFFISIVVYALFLGAPIASAVVFIYEKYTVNVINDTTRALDTAIRSFSESDLLAVELFDKRLTASTNVLNMVVPLDRIVSYFLNKTPQTVAFNRLTLDTHETGMVTVTAEVVSNSFDYVLFYRDELLRDVAFASSTITDITYAGEAKGREVSNQMSTQKENQAAIANVGKLKYTVAVTLPISFIPTLPDPQMAIEILPTSDQGESLPITTTANQ